MTSKPVVYPFVPRPSNTYTNQSQGLTLTEADAQRANELHMAVERHMIQDQKDLVKKVTGVSHLGIFKGIANAIEALKHDVDSDSSPHRQRLYRKAREWFEPDGPSESGRREARMYPQVKAFLYLISLLVWETLKERELRTRKKSESLKCVLQRYLLPHKDSDICGDLASRKRHDVSLCWHDLDTDIEEKCEAFLAHEESRAKGKKASGRMDQTSDCVGSAPTRKKRSTKAEADVTQGPFWRCFGVIECKADHRKSQEQKEFGQLSWYACSALEVLFERNNLWGLVISTTKVRFVFFTHGAAITSQEIDVGSDVGRKEFVKDFLRFYLCSSYRAGFDPTKRWLEDVQQWEVKCFGKMGIDEGESTSNKEKTDTVKDQPLLAYVDPIPFKTRGSLFGRRTRCHLASLSKGAKTYELILKESWTELDQDPKRQKTMNTVFLPNEVRIFQEIEKGMESEKYKSIAYSIPRLKAGGSVLAEETRTSDSECYSTVTKYCGGLGLFELQSAKQPSTSTSKATVTASEDGNRKFLFRPVNRVHQRLLMEPVGQSMDTLHPRTKDKKKSTSLTPDEKKTLFFNVSGVFMKLCYVIYILYTEFGVYHRDLSEGNVLVRTRDGVMYPLLIDFDHSRLVVDDSDSMQSRTGTTPFMSILNLAGYSNDLTILDELESFLYLWVWKCTIGFSPSEITRSRATKTGTTTQQGTSHQRSKSSNVERPSWKTASSRMGNTPTGQTQAESSFTPQPKMPLVRLWATGNPGTDCLSAKCKDTGSHSAFNTVLDDLRPEFWKLKALFLELREILFDWDVGQGVKNTGRERKAVDEGIDENSPPKRLLELLNLFETKEEMEQRWSGKPAEPETSIDESCHRLLDRKAEKGRILEKFVKAIAKYYGTIDELLYRYILVGE
ncbi:hypothetical protein IWQ61_009086 [Dispira simplex]|nr:hypothetical protein IWQ61_009086 [Dispira simplex]